MKLATHFPRNIKHVYIKSHNSDFNDYSVVPLFGLKSSYKKFNLAYNSKNIQHFRRKLGAHVPRNNTHVYTKSHNSGFKNCSVMRD